RVEVACGFTVLVGADLASNKQKFRRIDPRQLRILPERLAETVGIENLNTGHRAGSVAFSVVRKSARGRALANDENESFALGKRANPALRRCECRERRRRRAP